MASKRRSKAPKPGRPEPGHEGYPLPEAVPCPFCGDEETEVHSPFGGVMSVAQYYCRRCRTVFEWIK